jgi:hypothetical protein
VGKGESQAGRTSLERNGGKLEEISQENVYTSRIIQTEL